MGKPAIAFEPLPRNLHHLCRNIKLNGWRNIEIFPVALSDKIGVVDIYGGNTGASIVKGWAGIPESYVHLVPCLTLDKVLGRRFQKEKLLILVDIEGAEHAMLKGAQSILQITPRPIWLVEIVAHENQPQGCPINPNFESTFEIFFQNGYRAYTGNSELREITRADVQKIARGELKTGVHNYLFYENDPAR